MQTVRNMSSNRQAKLHFDASFQNSSKPIRNIAVLRLFLNVESEIPLRVPPKTKCPLLFSIPLPPRRNKCGSLLAIYL